MNTDFAIIWLLSTQFANNFYSCVTNQRVTILRYIIKKNMCVASLTLIFTRSVGTLQPTRPLGRVGSKFNWSSEDQCQRSHSKSFFYFFYPTLRMQIQPLDSLKTVSKVGDLSSTIAMTVHCFGTLSQVRAIGHCVIGQECDLLCPDWLNWWVCPWVTAFEIQIFLTP